ncbi:hypothetical protein IFM89_012792 [Coptis chinensis]|uniref:Uncharacterized protein n=1 Tax=Coptis chinensis TaxID=261450 RepID=A0A835H2V8_9MAGN|nr:hypothetical protein IFM89_012792 [Coptis chinensis]
MWTEPDTSVFVIRSSVFQIKIGCCTVDILKQLSGEEISRIPSNGSGIAWGDLLHIFYPLYPPFEDILLDLSLAPESLQILSIPDIVILPSDLSPSVTVLVLSEKNSTGEQTRCIAVNPGRLAKGVWRSKSNLSIIVIQEVAGTNPLNPTFLVQLHFYIVHPHYIQLIESIYWFMKSVNGKLYIYRI